MTHRSILLVALGGMKAEGWPLHGEGAGRGGSSLAQGLGLEWGDRLQGALS